MSGLETVDFLLTKAARLDKVQKTKGLTGVIHHFRGFSSHVYQRIYPRLNNWMGTN
jgi:hypothetical protein